MNQDSNGSRPKTLDELADAPYNPRRIDDRNLRGLCNSIDSFGDLSGIVFNLRTGQLVCGHQRLRAIRRQYGEDAKIDESGGIALPGGESMAVRYVDWDDRTERLANLTANNPFIAGEFTVGASEILAQLSDDPIFAMVNSDLLAKQVGMSYDTPTEQPDGNAENTQTRVCAGDIWSLGQHRLSCGSSTDEDCVARLMDGQKPFIMVTDPPYGVNYNPGWRCKAGAGARKTSRVLNDDIADWFDAYRLADADIAYIWHGASMAHTVRGSIERAGYEIVCIVIWIKQNFVLSRGNYHRQYEPCFYVSRPGVDRRWTGGRKRSDVWQIAGSQGFYRNENSDTDHPTQKPIKCMQIPVENHGAPGDIVYDPFVGSGTTIMAEEATGRICYAIELEPNICEVAISRWERHTGQTAKKIA